MASISMRRRRWRGHANGWRRGGRLHPTSLHTVSSIWREANPRAAPYLFRERCLTTARLIAAPPLLPAAPICCPSRAQLLTGRYMHNLKTTPVKSPTAASTQAASTSSSPVASCMHVNLTLVENRSFARQLRGAGYRTALFGKYLNRWSNGAPDDFETFFGNGGGSYIAPKFRGEGQSHPPPDGCPQGTLVNCSCSLSVPKSHSPPSRSGTHQSRRVPSQLPT